MIAFDKGSIRGNEYEFAFRPRFVSVAIDICDKHFAFSIVSARSAFSGISTSILPGFSTLASSLDPGEDVELLKLATQLCFLHKARPSSCSSQDGAGDYPVLP